MTYRPFDLSSLEREITERGYAEIEHTIPNEWAHDLVHDYAQFTLNHPDPEPRTMCDMLPSADTAAQIATRLDDLDRSKDSQKTWHKYRTNVEGVAKPDGYTNRSMQVSALRRGHGIVLPDEDPKEYYHHNPAHLPKVLDAHLTYGWGALPPEVYKLDTSFYRIHNKITQVMVQICAALEPTHPKINQLITPQSLHTSPLRLLFYHPTTNPSLAGAHYDKSVITLQIGESHQGLHIATDKDQPLTPVVRDSNLGVLFASHKLSAEPTANDPGGHYPDSALRPAWHGVNNSELANEGREVPITAAEVCGRWALVFFANEKGYIPVNKAAMHTR